MLRIQEVIYRVRPDVLIETGVAHGGSLIFYASLFKAMGKGRHHVYDAASMDERARRAGAWLGQGTSVRVSATPGTLGGARLEPGAG